MFYATWTYCKYDLNLFHIFQAYEGSDKSVKFDLNIKHFPFTW